MAGLKRQITRDTKKQRKLLSKPYLGIGKEARSAFFFLLPLLVCYSILIIYPFLSAIYFSFTDYHLMFRGLSFTGLDNFKRLFGDPTARVAILNTFVWTGGIVAAQMTVGMLAALLLNQRLPGTTLFRALILLPWVVSPIVAAQTWRYIYDPMGGLLNWFLKLLSISSSGYDWLGDPSLAFFSVMLVAIWRGIPFCFVMILAGLQAVPKELYEAAEVDGANSLSRFIYVTMPLLEPILLVTLILRFIWMFNNFDFVWVLTRGGPGTRTQLLSVLAYQNAFSFYDIGYGSAIGVFMFLVLLGPVLIYFRLLARQNTM